MVFASLVTKSDDELTSGRQENHCNPRLWRFWQSARNLTFRPRGEIHIYWDLQNQTARGGRDFIKKGGYCRSGWNLGKTRRLIRTGNSAQWTKSMKLGWWVLNSPSYIAYFISSNWCFVRGNILNVVGRHADSSVKYYCLYVYHFMGLRVPILAQYFSKSQNTIHSWISTYESLYKRLPMLFLDEAKARFQRQFHLSISTSHLCTILHEEGLVRKVLEILNVDYNIDIFYTLSTSK